MHLIVWLYGVPGCYSVQISSLGTNYNVILPNKLSNRDLIDSAFGSSQFFKKTRKHLPPPPPFLHPRLQPRVIIRVCVQRRRRLNCSINPSLLTFVLQKKTRSKAGPRERSKPAFRSVAGNISTLLAGGNGNFFLLTVAPMYFTC